MDADDDDEELRRPGEIRFGGMSFALPPPGDDHVDDHDDGDVDDHVDDDVDALPFFIRLPHFLSPTGAFPDRPEDDEEEKVVNTVENTIIIITIK